jgi:chloride channel 7
LLGAWRLQVKCVPWLPSEPWAKRPLDLVPARAAMAAPVVTLREHVKVEDLRQVRLCSGCCPTL